MKMKIYISVLLLVFTVNVFSQSKITVKSGNELKYYSSLEKVVENLKDNDEVYLRELSNTKSENYSSIIIKHKNISFYGVGYDKRHTGVFAPSYINKIYVQADNFKLVGVRSSVDIKEGIKNTTIEKCNIWLNLYPNTSCFINNCKVGGIRLESRVNLSIYNSIISNYIEPYNFERGKKYDTYNVNLVAKNTIFNTIYILHFINSSLKFENNIFLKDLIGLKGIFKNNILKQAKPSGNPNLFLKNNKYNQTINFVDRIDYELPTNSSAKNAGSDGKDCGIYGGLYPFNYNSPIPKILELDISEETNKEGKLKVKMKVKAQKQ